MLSKKYGFAARVICLLMLVIIFVTGCSSEKTGTQNSNTRKTVKTFVDGTGKEVKISCPVDKIVCITSGVSEILYALGSADKIIGRDSYSIFPADLEKIPVMAKSSFAPNLEAIIQSAPDVVIADTMLKDDLRAKLEEAGLPVLVYTTSYPHETALVTKQMGELTGKEEIAAKLIAFSDKYYQLIKDRVARIAEDKKPRVYYEWNKPYYSAGDKTPAADRIALSGGKNIAAGQKVKYPELTPEWLAGQDPQIIICMASRDAADKMKALYDEILARAALKQTTAVSQKKVYIMSWGLGTGIRSVIGSLYWAKWFHPDVFADLDPEAVHSQLLQEFYHTELKGTWVYPDVK
ncbi:ABC transporter substrate-binding protein [Neomoorella mulderi]|uniref:Vitamin B12-binding protein n=1 Tax=Moorella mulderi DSM 14980 TaxID=1122241 RepID=A0A151AZ52_9FIRM|nr:ABC transporter substrate-binding protein [Moorella mulderi]KYH32918.1 vitamin B12-binding protein precursor [Moorella mulderi DSM 14980]